MWRIEARRQDAPSAAPAPDMGAAVTFHRRCARLLGLRTERVALLLLL